VLATLYDTRALLYCVAGFALQLSNQILRSHDSHVA
jgi:hypothetical protein